VELENSLFMGADCCRERPETVNQRKQAWFYSQCLWSNFFFCFGYYRFATDVLLWIPEQCVVKNC